MRRRTINFKDADLYTPPRRVLVIGAGLAGIGAARTLQEHGVEVTVLEARDRIGGRCWTRDKVDFGAHWIHGTEGNPVTNLARQLNIPTLFVGGDSSYSGGWDHLVIHGPRGRVAPDDKLRSILLADEIRDELDVVRRKRTASGAPDISMHEALRGVLDTRSLTDDERRAIEWHIAICARDDCAADEPSLSFLWWDDGYEVYGYGDSVFVGGYAAFVNALAEGLDIRLEKVATHIEHGLQGTDDVRVTTADGSTFAADAVIVTLPLGVLKAGSVRFTPPLPPEKLSAIDRLGMGTLAKVALHFDRPFWPADQYVFGYQGEPVGEHPTMVISLWKTHRIPVLVMLAGGELGRELESAPLEEVRESSMRVLRDIFGKVPEPGSFERTRWSVDPFSLGAYSYVAVGATPNDIRTLGDPVGNSLLFAGEATYRHHWAGAHGALASGLREAARVLNDPGVLPPRAFAENRRWRDTMMRATRLFNVLSSSMSPTEIDARLLLLSDSELFSAVPPNELRILATMFEADRFEAGDVLFRAGDPASCVYTVTSGEVEVQLGDGFVVGVHGRGHVVGELGLFESGFRTATVVARTTTEVLTLDYQRFQRFLLAFPESLYALLQLTVHRLVSQSNTPRSIPALRGHAAATTSRTG